MRRRPALLPGPEDPGFPESHLLAYQPLGFCVTHRRPGENLIDHTDRTRPHYAPEFAHRGIQVGERDRFFAPQHVNRSIRKWQIFRTADMQFGLGLQSFGGDSLLRLFHVGRHWIDAMNLQVEASRQSYDIAPATTADVDSHSGAR